MDWVGRSLSYALMFAGYLLFSTLLRSAAGPPDALRGERAAPPPAGLSAPTTVPVRLIAAPNGAQPLPGLSPPARQVEVDTTGVTDASPARVATLEPATSRIVIPRIGVDTRVVEVGVLPSGEMETAAFAAGRLTYSAEAGDRGNVVLAGHNDIHGEVFRRLAELQVGEELTLYRDQQAFTYRVEQRTIVREDGATALQRRENARWMDPTEDPVATLISCYPYRVDTHRVIVRARLIG
jgi:sortase A